MTTDKARTEAEAIMWRHALQPEHGRRFIPDPEAMTAAIAAAKAKPTRNPWEGTEFVVMGHVPAFRDGDEKAGTPSGTAYVLGWTEPDGRLRSMLVPPQKDTAKPHAETAEQVADQCTSNIRDDVLQHLTPHTQRIMVTHITAAIKRERREA